MNNPFSVWYEEDDWEKWEAKRISDVMKSVGINLTVEESRDLWLEHSLSYCAGWLVMPEKDEDLIAIVKELLPKKKGKYQ